MKTQPGKRVLIRALPCRPAGSSFLKTTGEDGVGTIITAFFMGPLIEFFNQKAARPFLYGKDA